MSLEAALAECTAALKENTAALKEAIEGRDRAAAAVTEAVTGKKGRPAGAKDKTTAAADEAKTPAPKPEPTGPMTIDQFRLKAGEFLNVPGTEDADAAKAAKANAEKARRKEFVKSINAHFGADKIVNVQPTDYDKILGWFAEFLAGITPNFSEGEDDLGGAEPEVEDEDDIG